MNKKSANYITPLGLERLINEQSFYIKVERPRVTKVVTWAASLGDRSENADYQYAKKRLREIDRRLRFLAKRIDLALVVDPVKQNFNCVKFGATVTIESFDGTNKIISIVGVDEINSKKAHISWKSPLAKALLNKMEGDDIEVAGPVETIEYIINKIEYKKIDMETAYES